MTVESNIHDAYNVSVTDDNKIRLQLVVTRAEFPAFSLVLPIHTALRIGEALIANAGYAKHRGGIGSLAGGSGHAG